MQNYIDFRNDSNYENLKEPAKIIKAGGIVIFPTETVYGIGTNGFDENAIRKLYEVKERPLNKPISLLVSNIDMVDDIAKDISINERKIMEAFFPGPLTIILKKKDIVPDILTSNGDTVGVRMPEGDIARKLVEYAGVPIATPSANITGKPSGTNIFSIKKDFDGKVDCFIDGGESRIGRGSTIVKMVDNKIIILREGIITKDQIEKVLV